jgi:hypothetical protein
VHTTKQIASVLEWQILRVLLWAIRQIGFRLVLDSGRMIYEWVSDSDGAFDHWFRSVDQHCAVGSLRQQLGFWRLLWQISSRSQLLVGASRRSYKCRVVVRSEEYYCTEPIFSVRALSSRPATSVNASARLVMMLTALPVARSAGFRSRRRRLHSWRWPMLLKRAMSSC